MTNSTLRIQTIETIEVLHRQEQQYTFSNYLSQLPKFSSSSAIDEYSPVDAKYRLLMAEWMNSVADALKYSKESVEMALNCLDRFMSTSCGYEAILFDRTAFELAAMAALYSTVKIHEHQVMTPSLMSELSRGVYSQELIEEMESDMLQAIDWRVNPPTVMSFVRLYADLLPNYDHRKSILEITQQQIEIISNDYEFCCFHERSRIAVASMLNAMEMCGVEYDSVQQRMDEILRIDDATCITDIRNKIYEYINCNVTITVKDVNTTSTNNTTWKRRSQSGFDYLYRAENENTAGANKSSPRSLTSPTSLIL